MSNRSWPILMIFVSTVLGTTLSPTNGQEGSTSSVFEPPVRLRADGQFIDTGSAGGHSAPCVEDLDGDGLKDLIVGDYGGKFRLYRNVGTANGPSYENEGFIQAGDQDANVLIYCCIGSQARFGDLNGDGIRDMISNSYDPGHCYIFWGLLGNRFDAREELLDKACIPIRTAPIQNQDLQSFGSFFEMVDWDNDGDLDILIGCFDGTLKLRTNEGTKTKPEFAAENVDVVVDGKPLRVKDHFCPKVADWDGDGLWDIIAGSDDGSVTFFRNVGSKTSPAFAEGENLVKSREGNAHNRVIWNESGVVPGIRSQAEVVDFNGDGKLDLLVGDYYTAYDLKPDLSPQQKQEVEELAAESEPLGKASREKLEALRKQFAERYPGDEIFSDEAQNAWTDEYGALTHSPEAKEMERNEALVVNALRPYLATTHRTGEHVYALALPHGHVWLYLRK